MAREEFAPREPELKERLNPRYTLEMGFQSYEKLAGDGEYRDQQRQAFFDGDIRNPRLDYPLLDEQELQQSISKLEPLIEQAETLQDEMASNAVRSSVAYRMNEMHWLIEAANLNRLAEENPDSEAFTDSATRYQEMNEQLYGTPETELSQQVYGEIIGQANSKQLHPSAEKILIELRHGTTINAAGEEITIRPLPYEGEECLPQLDKQTLAPLKEVLQEDFQDAFTLVDDYWQEVAQPRAEASGETPQFSREDMKVLFTELHNQRDPEGLSGIQIIEDENATQLAWDSQTMSVKVGGKRAPIKTPTVMAAKLIHEYGVHGQRTVNGAKSDLPVLATGLFTEASEGERPDYLTFEEGLASLSEITVDDSFDKWRPQDVDKYLCTSLAYEGRDFREIYETSWRARALMAVGDGEELSEEIVKKQQKQAYLSTVRVLRGTPTEQSGGEDKPVLTFNKDLAYLQGKADAVRYLEQAGDDKTAIRRLFAGKFDPNNATQNELAARYGVV